MTREEEKATLEEVIKIAKKLNILSQNSRSLTEEESEKTAKAIEEMSESDGKTIF